MTRRHLFLLPILSLTALIAIGCGGNSTGGITGPQPFGTILLVYKNNSAAGARFQTNEPNTQIYPVGPGGSVTGTATLPILNGTQTTDVTVSAGPANQAYTDTKTFTFTPANEQTTDKLTIAFDGASLTITGSKT